MPPDLDSLRIDRSLKSPPPGGAVRRRWPVVVLIVGIVIVILLFAHAPAAVEVQTLRVGPITALKPGEGSEVVLNATGYIVAAHKIQLAPKVVGRVSWIGVDMGDRVHKGDVLVRLEDDEYVARVTQQQGQLDAAKAKLDELIAGARPEEVAQAKAQFDQAQADLKNATLNVERNRKLAGTNAVSEQTIDDAEAKYSLMKAKAEEIQATYDLVRAGPRKEQIAAQRAIVEEAQGILDLVKVDLSNTVIRAAIDGTVLDRNVEIGEYVTTGFVGDRGAKGYVVSLADLNDLRVELDISQSDFPKTAMGQTCTITTDAYPDRKYAGTVDQIAPEANRQKATVLVKVKVTNPDELLRPDMNASVAFHPRTASTNPAAGVTIPATALHNNRVFVVQSDKALERAVEVGPTYAEGIRITGGLSEGDVLIMNPPQELKDGTRVHFTTR